MRVVLILRVEADAHTDNPSHYADTDAEKADAERTELILEARERGDDMSDWNVTQQQVERLLGQIQAHQALLSEEFARRATEGLVNHASRREAAASQVAYGLADEAEG